MIHQGTVWDYFELFGASRIWPSREVLEWPLPIPRWMHPPELWDEEAGRRISGRRDRRRRKLSDRQIAEILASPHETCRVLADRYGVSAPMISHIRNDRRSSVHRRSDRA